MKTETIFEPTTALIWSLYCRIVRAPELWTRKTFRSAAMNCGFRKISMTRHYFSFLYQGALTGEARISGELISEIRLFLEPHPRELGMALDRQGKGKGNHPGTHYAAKLCVSEYSSVFRQELGKPRLSNGNEIFEADGHRVRLLAAECVWVVISHLPVVAQLPYDWWAAKAVVPGGESR